MSKKCKHCKEPFTPMRSSLEKYCLKPECVRVWVAAEKEKTWKKTKAKKKEELMTVQDYIKIAQQVFNKYIRLRDKDKGCISCGKPLIGKYDAGHLYPAGTHWSVRFDEFNVHGQCVECNQWKHGNQLEYYKGIEKRYINSQRILTELAWKATETRKYTIDELKEIIATYKKKIKDLERKC